MTSRRLMLGNEAIARGLVENGCSIATSYPGTPASEILSSLAAIKQIESAPMDVKWAINEKVAFEIAYAGSLSGLRTSVSMKQVGLNVASDPLMSAAYMGAVGGFLVISADDPGPHSSQTEQDSRMMALFAKIPVLDPESPEQAKSMIATAYELSEAFETAVMLRPTTRVCHTRQDILEGDVKSERNAADFKKDPKRWAATPKFRFILHQQLEEKLHRIAEWEKTAPVPLNPQTKSKKAIVTSGVAAAHTKEIIDELDLWTEASVYQVLQPFPLHRDFISNLIDTHDEILVIEETMPVIEYQIADRHRVSGRLSGAIPDAGELLPETVEGVVKTFLGIPFDTVEIPSAPGKRPTLCPGCPHRASFFAIKKAAPKAIYTSDIGCYTLGLNLGAVDTVLCMGAALGQAAGFYHAYKNIPKRPDIVATIGDSTFFHSGIPPLVDAVVQNIGMTIVILDNRTTAMTGNQPTPASGFGPSREPLNTVSIDALVRACGVGFCEEGDPYRTKAFTSLVRDAVRYSRQYGPAVVIARRPCVIDKTRTDVENPNIFPVINEKCDGCGYCIEAFECPALLWTEEKDAVKIDDSLCSGCGVCIFVCPKKAIQQ